MDDQQRLLDRLDAIGAALAATGEALALLALGSAGLETERIDAYSDLDFFAIVKPGRKNRFLSDLDWMAAPIAFAFQNTLDGYKVLYEDGIYAEFAVFEPHDLQAIPFAPGRIVWQADEFDAALVAPRERTPYPYTQEWLLGETLTQLYIGMGRFRRGEKLAAQRLIQFYAVEQVIRLAPLVEPEQPGSRDPFAGERRFEQRFPGVAALLPSFMQGYQRSPQSAKAILDFLDTNFEVNPTLKARIIELCAEP